MVDRYGTAYVVRSLDWTAPGVIAASAGLGGIYHWDLGLE